MDSREVAFVLPTHEVAKSTVTLRERTFKSQTYPNNHKYTQIHPKNTNPKILKNLTKESKKIDCHESLRDSHNDANTHTKSKIPNSAKSNPPLRKFLTFGC
ncbi:hypothetical protein HMPREF2086_00017 [Helicobacter macacae MIT 99-5501]|uniref:Uncharacterized protein n=2 Tax=Helicobacter TaxID=209 RepID=V8CCD5_9HELI|nr:hypothetical protein HMPREF2086_00017 [Helicobacter macacae MIT 99-5501]